MFNLPTPLNTSGYCCFSSCEVSATAAMITPIFSIPNFVAVCLSSRGIPFPLITMNSARAYHLMFITQTSSHVVCCKMQNYRVCYASVALRCGAVRCGAVRCGAVRCGAVRCGAVRCGAVRCGAVRYFITFTIMLHSATSK